MPPPIRQPQLGDPDYNFSAFKRDLFGGGLRWLATALAVLNAAMVALILAGVVQPEIQFPFHIAGETAKWLLVASLVIWSVIAVVHWRVVIESHRAGK